MKGQHIATLAILSTSMFAAGLVGAGEEKWSLKSPTGISFSEFKDYESWMMIGSSQPDDGSGCGSSPDPGCIKSIRIAAGLDTGGRITQPDTIEFLRNFAGAFEAWIRRLRKL